MGIPPASSIAASCLLKLKANHPTLHNQVQQLFQTAQKNEFSGIDFTHDKRIEKGYHPIEIREVWVIPITAIPDLHQPKSWAGLKSVVMVHRIRHLWNKTTYETHYYLTSLDSNVESLIRETMYFIEWIRPDVEFDHAFELANLGRFLTRWLFSSEDI